MANFELYPTLADYPNATALNKMAYSLRDSITIVNPFVAVLYMVLVVLAVAGYYTYAVFTGKTRLFATFTAAAFVTFIVSVFFALAEWITPYDPLHFLAWMVAGLIGLIFYRE